MFSHAEKSVQFRKKIISFKMLGTKKIATKKSFYSVTKLRVTATPVMPVHSVLSFYLIWVTRSSKIIIKRVSDIYNQRYKLWHKIFQRRI